MPFAPSLVSVSRRPGHRLPPSSGAQWGARGLQSLHGWCVRTRHREATFDRNESMPRGLPTERGTRVGFDPFEPRIDDCLSTHSDLKSRVSTGLSKETWSGRIPPPCSSHVHASSVIERSRQRSAAVQFAARSTILSMLSRLIVASLALAVTSGRGAGMLRPQSWDARAAGHKASSGAVGVRAKVFGSTTVVARTCVVWSGEAWC